MRRRSGWRKAAAAVVLVPGLLLVPTAAEAVAPYEVIAEGLDNPRGISLRRGLVYVAEAGRGGDTCVESVDPESGEPSTICAGDTAGVIRIHRDGKIKQVTTGWPSVAEADGSFASGVVDVTTKRGLYFLLANITGLPPELADETEDFGKLFRRKDGANHERADISAFEEANNPDGGIVDTNPNGFFTTGGVRHLVVDAAGNSLLYVNRRNEVSLVTTLPGGTAPPPGAPPGVTIPFEPVPTAVTVGPDKAYYVGQLTGFPFPVGGAKVFRVVEGEEPTVYAEGYTNIIDVTFDREGNLYVLEIATNGLTSGDPTGALWRITPDGARERLSGPELQSPGGVAISTSTGDAYVTNNGVSAGGGQVLKYDL